MKHFSTLAHLLPLLLLLSLSSCTAYIGVFRASPYLRSQAQIAAELREQGHLEPAIEAYLAHIDARRWDKSRPEKENPYFYYLLIGDIYLQMEKPLSAEQAYLTAKQNKVMDDLVLDRFRELARWYENKKDFESAIALLEKHRDLEPLSIDTEIDRLHRKMVAEEQSDSA